VIDVSAPRIPPDDALVPALGEEVGTPTVALPRKPAVSPAQDRAVGSIDNTHHVAAALRDEVHGVAFVLVARNECGRIRHRLRFELPYHPRQPRSSILADLNDLSWDVHGGRDARSRLRVAMHAYIMRYVREAMAEFKGLRPEADVTVDFEMATAEQFNQRVQAHEPEARFVRIELNAQ